MSGRRSASIAEFADGLFAIDGVLPKDLGAKFVTLLDAARWLASGQLRTRDKPRRGDRNGPLA
jgi:hypothetical protein